MLGPRLQFVERTKVIFRGEKLLFFGGNDYHRLSSHPEVQESLCRASREYGLSSAGSRITTGNHPLYVELEEKAAAFFQAEDAAVFSSGYLCNLILLEAIGGEFHRLFIDGDAHFSLLEASLQKPREKVHTFQHADPEDLKKTIRGHLQKGERPLVLTDGVFSTWGDIPPLGKYLEILQEFGGKLLVDDAHALGVVGETGKGSWEELNVPREGIFQTGTLSKGIGAFGGVIFGSRELIAEIQKESRAFIGSTGMPLPVAAAGIKALEILRRHPEMVRGLRERMFEVKKRIRRLGFPVPESPAPIASIHFSQEEKNEKLSRLLLKNGIYPPLIRYSKDPPGGYFRFTFSSAHTDEEVESLLRGLETF